MADHVDPELWNTVPRFAHGMCLDRPSVSAALATETAAPLPSPPPPSPLNAAARATIERHPDLFQITTPINVDRFEQYLRSHPNRPYVESVCRGLRDGFWPWADSDNPDMWKKQDNSYRPMRNAAHVKFARKQRDEEIGLGRFSPSFGSELLPGMCSSPVGAQPKSTPGKFRLVNDHSQGPHSLNSMIGEPETLFPLDDIRNLVGILLDAQQQHGKDRKLILWKSDVKDAYRLLPMHPLWQIRQIVTIDGKRHVDRCNAFGSRAGSWVWLSFISLVLWIAVKIENLEDILGYVDDHFSWEFDGDVLYYEPYRRNFPQKQARYLMLWDRLGIPHEEEKQLFCNSRSTLEIIGLEIDPNEISVGLSDDKLANLSHTIDHFVGRMGQTTELSEFQELAGLLQSALVAYPKGRPGLSGLYAEISGLQGPRPRITITPRVCIELGWFQMYIKAAKRTYIERLKSWGRADDLVNYTDACQSGLGIWVPALNKGFQAKFDGLPGLAERVTIDLEAMAIFAAVVEIAVRYRPSRLVVFSDSQGSVDIYESLNTQDAFRNALLMGVVDCLREHGIWCRFYHVSGEENAIADALSRFNGLQLVRVDTAKMQIQEFGELMKLCTQSASHRQIS